MLDLLHLSSFSTSQQMELMEWSVDAVETRSMVAGADGAADLPLLSLAWLSLALI